jgi:hypothetical protein
MREAITEAIDAYEGVYGDYAEDIQTGGQPAISNLREVAIDAALEAFNVKMKELLTKVIDGIAEDARMVEASAAQQSLKSDVGLGFTWQTMGVDRVREALFGKEAK